MSARSKNLTRQIVVRLPQDLYDRLERDAADNGRTVAQSVRFILLTSLRGGEL